MVFNQRLTKLLLVLIIFLYGSLGLDLYRGNFTWVRALVTLLITSVLLIVVPVANYHFEEWQARRQKQRQQSTKLVSRREE